MYHILVIDDEFPIREWLVGMIRAHRPDYIVSSAHNGLDALEQMTAGEIHLVISDIRMPLLDGIGLFAKMETLFPDTGIIVLSSYDDYNYVRSAFKHAAVDYLLKAEITEESLLASIDHYFEKRRNQSHESEIAGIISSVLQDNEITAMQVRQELLQYLVDVPEKNYFLFLFQSDDRLIPSVNQTVLVFCVPLSADEYLGCVSLNTLPSTLAQLQTQSQFARELQNFNSCRYLLLSELQYAGDSLPQVMRLLYRYRSLPFYHRQNLLLKNQTETSFAQYFQAYLDIISAAKTRNAINIHETLAAFLDYVETNYFPDIRQLQITGIKILEELYFNLVEANAETLAVLNQSLTQKIHHCKHITEYKETLHSEVDTIFSRFQITPKTSSSRIARAIAYIEENYAGPITLNEVADLVYLNPEYFSRNFKKETGTNFNSYVNTIRLQQAVRLVSNTDKKLSEIAELCGFQSFSYFSKRFKEMFGCSPYTLRSARSEDIGIEETKQTPLPLK